ncbi:ribonucleotide reductase of class III anaerobic activating protein [Vibrio maritimus]|uniref:Anaerobic ribonucleoside-triphosphate reductase-activating protein n=1 Tax=Vibrio maritimus TaxID=990268 RepID=A0A090S8B2_9VIBR|nr:ribonucleotide reductase of class III anaerobic activating protein [Vibrio maritimus]
MSNYAKYINCDLVNGKGVRCTLFFTGCNHGCAGCHNEHAWNPKSGHPVTADLIDQILEDLADRDGLSLSGGDPLHSRNIGTTTDICRRVKERYPEKDIWLWTGYEMDKWMTELPLFQYLDVIIDGKFDKDLPTRKPFRGSDNQRMWVIKYGQPFLYN